MENIRGDFCFLVLVFDSDVRFNPLPKIQERLELAVSSGVGLTIFFDSFLL